MTPTDRVITFRPDADILAGMEALKERDGVPFSEQIRRALRDWLAQKNVMKQTASRRVSPRRKA